MRRSKESDAGLSTRTAPTPIPAAMPRVSAAVELSSDVPGISDLERGRTAALIATLGRVQLTLDLIERRLGRLEDDIREIKEGQESLAEALLGDEEPSGFLEVAEEEDDDVGDVGDAPDEAEEAPVESD